MKSDNFHLRRGRQAYVTIQVCCASLEQIGQRQSRVGVSHRLQIRCHKSCGAPAGFPRLFPSLPMEVLQAACDSISSHTVPSSWSPARRRRCHLLLPPQRFSRRRDDAAAYAFLFIIEIAALLGFRREIVRRAAIETTIFARGEI